MFNLSLNSSLIGVLDKFEKSIVQQNNVLHEILRQSVTASKEHYLSNAKQCYGKIALDFSTWLDDVNWISTISCKDSESIVLATSRGSLHKYVRAAFITGKTYRVWKFQNGQTWITTFRQTNLAMHEYISKFSDFLSIHTPLHPQIQQAWFWPQILLKASWIHISRIN